MSCSTSSSSRNLTPSDHPKPGIVFGSKPMVGDSHSPPNPQYPLAWLVIEPNKHPHELNLIAKRANVRYPAKHICVSWSSRIFTLCVYIYIVIYLFSHLFIFCLFTYLFVYVYTHIYMLTCTPCLNSFHSSHLACAHVAPHRSRSWPASSSGCFKVSWQKLKKRFAIHGSQRLGRWAWEPQVSAVHAVNMTPACWPALPAWILFTPAF